MKEIKNLVQKIDEELCDAKEYSKLAIASKDEEDTSKGKVYYQMANDELSHATLLHDMAVKLINEAKLTIEPPQYMVDEWEEEHGEYIEKVAKIKYMLEMFKS